MDKSLFGYKESEIELRFARTIECNRFLGKCDSAADFSTNSSLMRSLSGDATPRRAFASDAAAVRALEKRFSGNELAISAFKAVPIAFRAQTFDVPRFLREYTFEHSNRLFRFAEKCEIAAARLAFERLRPFLAAFAGLDALADGARRLAVRLASARMLFARARGTFGAAVGALQAKARRRNAAAKALCALRALAEAKRASDALAVRFARADVERLRSAARRFAGFRIGKALAERVEANAESLRFRAKAIFAKCFCDFVFSPRGETPKTISFSLKITFSRLPEIALSDAANFRAELRKAFAERFERFAETDFPRRLSAAFALTLSANERLSLVAAAIETSDVWSAETLCDWRSDLLSDFCAIVGDWRSAPRATAFGDVCEIARIFERNARALSAAPNFCAVESLKKRVLTAKFREYHFQSIEALRRSLESENWEIANLGAETRATIDALAALNSEIRMSFGAKLSIDGRDYRLSRSFQLFFALLGEHIRLARAANDALSAALSALFRVYSDAARPFGESAAPFAALSHEFDLLLFLLSMLAQTGRVSPGAETTALCREVVARQRALVESVAAVLRERLRGSLGGATLSAESFEGETRNALRILQSVFEEIRPFGERGDRLRFAETLFEAFEQSFLFDLRKIAESSPNAIENFGFQRARVSAFFDEIRKRNI